MKIAVVGAGAMGAIFAVHFAEAGNAVLVIQREGPHLDAIRDRGLHLAGPGGSRTVQLRAMAAAPAEPQDLVVLATKATQVGAAARAALPLIGPETVVLGMQNGIGAADLIAEVVDRNRLALGIAAAFGASLPAPGQAEHKAMQAVRLGAFAGLPVQAIERLVKVWSEAGFATEAVPDITAAQWEKLVCNASFSAPCGLTGLTVGEALADAEVGPLCLAAGIEAWSVATRIGIRGLPADPERLIREFGQRVAGAKPSLLQDIEAGRPSEIDFINGAVPREAAKAGLAAPVNETLARLVRWRERSGR